MKEPLSEKELLEKWQPAIATPFSSGNQVDYLIDGWATFEAMSEAIETTFFENDGTYYIYFLAWFVSFDIDINKKKQSLSVLLGKAATYNVQIRCIFWDQLTTQNNWEYQSVNLMETGAAILDNNTLWGTVGAHHQKVLIVNGKKGLSAFCGGVDVNPDRIQITKKPKGAPMHDVHCRIIGNGARGLVDVFVQRWLAHPDHLKHDKTKKDGGKGPLIGLKDRLQNPNEKPKGKQYVAIARTFNFCSPKIKCSKEQSIQTSMIGAIQAARRYIYVEDQYMWNLTAAREIAKVLPRLQYVIILTNHPSQVTDWGVSDGGQSAHYEFMKTVMLTMEEHEISDQEIYKIKTYRRIIPKTQEIGPHTYVHSKCWIFDDELAVIGSANCNRRGWESDSEVMAAIFDEKRKNDRMTFAQELRMNLWAENLGMKKELLYDYLSSADFWPEFNETPPERSNVKFYDIYNFGRDKNFKIPEKVNMDTIDPGLGWIKPCPAGDSITFPK